MGHRTVAAKARRNSSWSQQCARRDGARRPPGPGVASSTSALLRNQNGAGRRIGLRSSISVCEILGLVAARIQDFIRDAPGAQDRLGKDGASIRRRALLMGMVIAHANDKNER